MDDLIQPVPADRRARRLAQLLVGVLLYGVGDGLLLRAGLGVDPWDVLHQGLSRTVGLPVGDWTIIVGVIVLLGWIPLRQRVGVGTLVNAALIGIEVNVTMAAVAEPRSTGLRIVMLLGSVLAIGVATGIYVGASLGPGPRDGLMTGLAARGYSVRVVRTGIELAVLVTGWLLGGDVGVGTVLYAVSIGPLVHVTLPAFAVRDRRADRWAGCVDAGSPAPADPFTG